MLHKYWSLSSPETSPSIFGVITTGLPQNSLIVVICKYCLTNIAPAPCHGNPVRTIEVQRWIVSQVSAAPKPMGKMLNDIIECPPCLPPLAPSSSELWLLLIVCLLMHIWWLWQLKHCTFRQQHPKFKRENVLSVGHCKGKEGNLLLPSKLSLESQWAECFHVPFQEESYHWGQRADFTVALRSG